MKNTLGAILLALPMLAAVLVVPVRADDAGWKVPGAGARSTSRQIDLPGEERTIERIACKYRSVKLRGGKAEVKLRGK